ncbi:peptidoglycan-binding protein [Actinoplanes sp. TRM 88003]|uniref:Peptidoglycan-binding protein n=1 Tax=Paractinoplanes aksuensis TaxID=2939490 RepID=A0ABT1DKM0_9ACTN|nr:peptidoglycan-binding domain-containing protein [Actinoplanes aksuensis]MCO8271392.1 peptidoglycan-binding protein [Actinoplanes aksuensis]
MSARGILTVVGSAVGGVIGLGTPPPPDPDTVRELLAELGMPAGDDLASAVAAFQARVGLRTDGVAGPRTVHFLTRYAMERRAWRLDLAA